tara:strand:- start:13582 stop:14295 length:714 start_codon:yes stop_codon:yes gene_type:complete
MSSRDLLLASDPVCQAAPGVLALVVDLRFDYFTRSVCLFVLCHGGGDARRSGFPGPAVASLFTLLFAAMFIGERVRVANLLGLVVAAAGLSMIGMQVDRIMTLAGFLLTICAASMWALGNVITRRIGKVNLVGLVVWGNLVPALPFLALSWWLEGPAAIKGALSGFGLESMLVLVYLAFGARGRIDIGITAAGGSVEPVADDRCGAGNVGFGVCQCLRWLGAGSFAQQSRRSLTLPR